MLSLWFLRAIFRALFVISSCNFSCSFCNFFVQLIVLFLCFFLFCSCFRYCFSASKTWKIRKSSFLNYYRPAPEPDSSKLSHPKPFPSQGCSPRSTAKPSLACHPNQPFRLNLFWVLVWALLSGLLCLFHGNPSRHSARRSRHLLGHAYEFCYLSVFQ